MSDSLRPMDCGPPDSSVHGILQARILELVAISFSRGSSWPGDRTQVSCIAGLYWLSHQGLNSNSEFTVLQVHWDRTADARMWTQTLIVCLKITLILENPQSFTSVSCLPVFQCVSPTVMEEVGRVWKINQERSEHVSEDWKEVRMEEKMSLSGIEREQKKKKGCWFCCCSATKSCPTLRPHGQQHTQLSCPSLSPGVCSDSCPWSLLFIPVSYHLKFYY